MSSLANQQQNLSFPGLLQIPGGITTTLQQVQDGNGNVTGLSLSSAGASVTTSSTFQASQNGTTLTGATARLISDGFGDLPTVKDFGAVGDGTTDDTAAFTAAIAASPTGVAVPAGSYKITGTVTGAFYSFGTVTVVTGTVTTIQNLANIPALFAASSGSALIGTIQSGTGAVARTVAAKLNDELNVLDFGAIGDGVADDTVAIQAAITAAGGNGTIYIPEGTYLLSATLNGLGNQRFIGAGNNNTIFRRFGDYGDTLYFANAGAAFITGIWFFHGVMPSAGFTILANLASSGSHINCANAQGLTIEKCWFWRMPYGINIQQGSLIKIDRCNVQGCWNRYATSTAQEGRSAIYIGSVAYTQLVDITNCYFGGSSAGSQTVTITTSDNGAQPFTMANANAGSQQAIRVDTCEGLLIDGCYMGGNCYQNIALITTGITSQVRISNNFLDAAGYDSSCLYFQPASNGEYPTGVTVTGNTFNCELQTLYAISSYNPYGSEPTIAVFVISGNTVSNSLGSGIFLRQIQAGIVSDNIVNAYNTSNLTAGGDPNYSCGIYVVASSGIYITNNLLGGAINSGSTTGSYCYQGIIIQGVNIEVNAKNNYFNGVGVSALNVGRIDKATIIVTGSANYSMTGTEDLVIINNTGSSAIQITPPTNVPPGYGFILKDGSGTAATHSLQFVGTVDGVTNPTYSTNYVVKTFTWNGTQWNVTGN